MTLEEYQNYQELRKKINTDLKNAKEYKIA